MVYKPVLINMVAFRPWGGLSRDGLSGGGLFAHGGLKCNDGQQHQ